jgi:serine phosphatase RsbU (regulator of sigma subunit)
MKYLFFFILLLSSVVYSQELDENFENLKGKELIDSLTNHAKIFYERNDEKSILYANKALDLSKRNKYPKGEINSLIILINSYIHLSKYDVAIKLNLKALELAENNQIKEDIPHLFNTLANCYLNISNFKLAIKYFRKSELEFINQKRTNELGNTYNNIAVCYDNQGNLDSALIYYNKAFPYYEKSKDKASLGLWYMNVGDLFRQQNKLKEAIEYQFKAEKLLIETNEKLTLLVLYNGIAMNYLVQDKINDALKYIALAEKIGIEIKSSLELANVYYTYYEIFKKTNDYKNQSKYLSMYSELIEKIYTVESAKSISEMQEKYEHDKKLKEIEILNKNKKLNLLEINRHKSSRNFLIIILLLGTFISLFLIFSIRTKNKTNNILKIQKQEILQQNKIMEQKNKEILDSITYAKRIQSAILPQPKLVKEFLEDSFVLYKPKDIVAGDFYWLEVVGDTVLFAAADCTGHGVPGAMVSVVCNNGLNRAVREFGLTNPNEILNKTRELVIEEFEKSDEDVKDGMDISLCALNTNTNLIKWAGANNPLWILRNKEILEYKGDKQPIGKHSGAKPFNIFQTTLQKNDIIYIFTDGYQDQFGGQKEKKFRVAQMKELFLSLTEKSMEEQRIVIDETFEKWKGELEQVDDVCVIGVRV